MNKIIVLLFVLLACFNNAFSQGVIVNAGFLILQPTAQVIITSNGNWTNNETSTYQNASTVEFISDLDIRFSIKA